MGAYADLVSPPAVSQAWGTARCPRPSSGAPPQRERLRRGPARRPAGPGRAQPLCGEGRHLRELPEFGEGLLLQLSDPLPAQAKDVPNFLEALRLAGFQPIA